MTHMPSGSDGRRPTARSKGKVEPPFRSVKQAHETLYHFHQPENEAGANLWLHRYLATYNGQQHRSEPHSRLEDWLRNLPASAVREICTWERFCAFAREPERCRVGGDARMSVEGTISDVDPHLAGEEVILWWGPFDRDLYVELDEQRHGPYVPFGGLIPLHRYREFHKTRTEERADRVAALAERLGLPRAALDGDEELSPLLGIALAVRTRPFETTPAESLYPNAVAPKLAIADALGLPLGRLPEEQRAWIDALLHETLDRAVVLYQLAAWRLRHQGRSSRGHD
jgi:hypothetical protein